MRFIYVQLTAVEAADIYPRRFKEIFNIFGDEREYFALWNNTYIIMQREISAGRSLGN